MTLRDVKIGGTVTVNTTLTNLGEIANAGTFNLNGTNNTGKFTGGADMRHTVLATNLEAAE